LFFLAPEGDMLSAKRLKKFGEVKFLTKPRHPKTPHHKFILGFIKALYESLKLPLSKFDVIVCTGSNFCIPPAIVAWLRRIPMVNIESPIRLTKPSKTALLLQRFVKITALQWDEQKYILKRGTVVGLILPRITPSSHDNGSILVACGTYGYNILTNILCDMNLDNVVLQLGKGDVDFYAKKCPKWKIFAVSEDFHSMLKNAKLVITHLSFTTIEAIAFGKPVIIIPNPEWTRTGSVEDAKYVAKKVNAILLTEITKQKILSAINDASKLKVPKLQRGTEKLANMILRIKR
jgi:UDP-N-acetylglucosamine:LPS N-acetylglucosamine transferase